MRHSGTEQPLRATGKVTGGLLAALGVGIFLGAPLAQTGNRAPISRGDPLPEANSGEARPRTPEPISPQPLGERLQALSDSVRNPRQLLLRTDRFDPLARGPRLPDIGPHDLTAQAYPPEGERYYLVQSTGPITPSWFDQLTGIGAEALAYVPNHAYLVRVDAAGRTDMESLPGVRWIGEYHPGYKISPSLADAIKTRPETEEMALAVSTFRDRSAVALREFLESLDPSVKIWHLRDTFVGAGRILLHVNVAASGRVITDLATHLDIEWIEEYHLPEISNDNSIWAIQSGDPITRSTPVWDNGLTGFGQIYGGADTGIDTDACQMRFGAAAADQTLLELTQPPAVKITNPGNKIQSYYVVGLAQAYDTQTGGFHGTHTTGNAVGDDFSVPASATSPGRNLGDGMAPAATVVFQDIGQADGSLDGLLVGQTDLHQQAHDSGVRAHNNSYNTPATLGGDQNEYSIDSQNIDEVMWRLRHYTVFFSASNFGPAPGGLGLGGSTAKNTLVIGSTPNASQSTVDIAFFSSHGPTADGRIKPDLAAPGRSLLSATETVPFAGQSQTDPPNNNCGTSVSSGTSFSSPTATGAGLLLRQYFFDGFYPSGTATVADKFDPSNALVKAALINSGRNLTGQYTASDGTGGTAGSLPNFGQGWGSVTLDDVLFFPGDLRELKVINDVLNGNTTVVPPAVTAAIQTAQTHEFTLPSVSTIEALRITLNWSDPAGAPGAGVVLVNNLDLEVIDPGGILYRGNVNFVNGFSTPAGATPADNLNPIEGVYIQDPAPGTYTVRVQGTSVPGNGTITPFNSNRQGYALIATGNFSAGDIPLIRFDSVGVSGGKGDDAFLDRTEAVDVAVTVRNDGASLGPDATVTLSVDALSQVPASAVAIGPSTINYGSVASKATATAAFGVTLLDDGIDHSNQRLRLRADVTATGAPATSDVFVIETMADTATIPLFDFEAGLAGWGLAPGTGPSPGPGLVTCEGTGAGRPTPTTELKFGRLNCVSPSTNLQDQRAFSPLLFVTLVNNTRLESLNFWHRLGTESFFDFAQVFVDHNSDGIYNFLDDFNGPDMTQMQRISLPFEPFFNVGRTANTTVLFRFLTDPFVTAFPGWFVDDVSLTTKSADPVADSTATLISVGPTTGVQGTASLDITVTGLNTGFINGTSVASFPGAGITVNSTTVTSPTETTVNITIDREAAIGPHSLTVTTAAEAASRSILFRVVPMAVLGVDFSNLSWSTVIGALSYDVLQGDLLALQASAGDFTTSTAACLADDHLTTSLPFAAVPGPGEGFWFLVGDVQAGGNGTFNDNGPALVGLRDAEISASPVSCP